ncbi:hypothetical protein ACH4E8_01935 [Streptomyces sp. NPDC017979]|uniref:hypothetical protein n=1 Tax=Streptomyces sp. NPDC017979 TaxID=3365024 RepID=UPI0037A904FC
MTAAPAPPPHHRPHRRAPAELSPLRAVVHARGEETALVAADRGEWLARLTVMAEHPALFVRLGLLATGRPAAP